MTDEEIQAGLRRLGTHLQRIDSKSPEGQLMHEAAYAIGRLLVQNHHNSKLGDRQWLSSQRPCS